MATTKRRLFKNPFAKTKLKEPAADKPWREYKDLKNGGWWVNNTEEGNGNDENRKPYYKTQLENIKETTKHVLKEVDGVTAKHINIMMLGYVQSGKSSTINSIFSVLHGKICKRAKSGSSDTSYTQRYEAFPGEKELKNIVLFDIMGVEGVQNQGLKNEDIESCINGQIEDNYQFDPRTKKEVAGNLMDQEVHCVMYCVDAESIFQEIIQPVQTRMQEIESKLRLTMQDRIVLVTKIDTICDDTKEDITKIFHSNNIKKVVEKAASVFRVPLNQVFPIKNYTDETETDENKNIPLLLALQKAVDFGADYLQKTAANARRKSNQQKEVLETKEQQTEI